MQRPGGPVIAQRHFQSGFGFWHVGGGAVTEPYFFAVGPWAKVKREAKAAGYTHLDVYNQVSHRTIKRKMVAL